MLATQGLRHPTDSSRFVRVLLSASLLASSGCAPNDGHSRSRITVLEANHAGGSGSRVSFEGRTVNGWGQAMNGSFERRGAGNRHGAWPLGDSIWKIRARSAGLAFDHNVLAELIARRWKQDHPYFALKKRVSRSVAGEARRGRNRVTVPWSCSELAAPLLCECRPASNSAGSV